MIVNLNTEVIKNKGLTPNEFILMYLIHTKAYGILYGVDGNLFKLSDKEIINILINLEKKRFIKIGYPIEITNTIQFSNIYPRALFLELLDDKSVASDISNAGWFEQLREIYPKSTPNGRKLHINLENTKKKYYSIVGKNQTLHNNILKAVTLEKNHRIRNNSLNYIQALSTYINQKGWEAYLDDVLKLKEGDINGKNESEQDNRWTPIL